MEAVFYNYLQMFSLNFLIKKEIKIRNKEFFQTKTHTKRTFLLHSFGRERQLKWKLSKFIF